MYGIDRRVVVSLLRAVARSKPYRSSLPCLLTREPEDVFYVPDEGWFVTYRLLAMTGGQLLVFICSDVTEDERSSVLSVFRGALEGAEVADDPVLDLSLD